MADDHFDAGCDLVELASTRWGGAVLLNAKSVLEERESIVEQRVFLLSYEREPQARSIHTLGARVRRRNAHNKDALPR